MNQAPCPISAKSLLCLMISAKANMYLEPRQELQSLIHYHRGKEKSRGNTEQTSGRSKFEYYPPSGPKHTLHMHHSTSQSGNEIAVALIVPPLVSDKTHSIEHGSITLEMVNRFTHTLLHMIMQRCSMTSNLQHATRSMHLRLHHSRGQRMAGEHLWL